MRVILRRAMPWVLALVLAAVVGFAAAWAVLFTMAAVLPPFRPEDDVTLHELVPVFAAHVALVTPTIVVLFVAWRRSRLRRR